MKQKKIQIMDNHALCAMLLILRRSYEQLDTARSVQIHHQHQSIYPKCVLTKSQCSPIGTEHYPLPERNLIA